MECRRFIEKIYKLAAEKDFAAETEENLKKILHKTIKKVGEDIDVMKFNTSVSINDGICECLASFKRRFG